MLDVIMDILLPYMRSQPMRPLSMEMLRGWPGDRTASAARADDPARRRAARRVSRRDVRAPVDEGVLSCMAAFLRMTLDATAWPMIYLGLIQKTKWSAMFVGGTGAVPDALGRCFESHGGRIRCDAPVEEFIMRGNRVAGVRLVGGEELFASEAVVTTCNPKVTLTRLLPDGYLERKLQKRAEGIPTALAKAASLKINMALSGRTSLKRHEQWRGDGLDLRHPLLDWHTLEQHAEGWEAVTRDEWPNPVPIGCVTVPTATDPTQAPEGCDTIWLWSGVIPVFPREPWGDVKERVGQGGRRRLCRLLRRPSRAGDRPAGTRRPRARGAVQLAPRQRLPRRSAALPLRTAAPGDGLRCVPDAGPRALPERRRYPSDRRAVRAAGQAGGRGGAPRRPSGGRSPLGRGGAARVRAASAGSPPATPAASTPTAQPRAVDEPAAVT